MNVLHRELPTSIGKPATRALVNAGITTLDQVQKFTDQDLLSLHGVGPKAVRILRDAISSLLGIN